MDVLKVNDDDDDDDDDKVKKCKNHNKNRILSIKSCEGQTSLIKTAEILNMVCNISILFLFQLWSIQTRQRLSYRDNAGLAVRHLLFACEARVLG